MTRRILLLSVMLIGAGLRLSGITGEFHHPDEGRILAWAQGLLRERTLHPADMSYGSLPLYLQAAAIFAVEWVRNALGWPGPLEVGQAQLVTRLLSALASLATLPLVMRLYASLNPISKSPLMAMIAPLILAVALLPVQLAHYGTVDSLLTLWTTAAVLFSLEAARGGGARRYCLAGFLVGLAAATKYTGVLASVPLLLSVLLGPDRGARLKGALLAGAISVLTFLTCMPYAWLDFPTFQLALAFEATHYATGGDTIFAVGPHTWLWNLDYLASSGLGAAVTIMSLLGLSNRLRLMARPELLGHPWRESLLYLAYPITLFAFLSRYPTRFDRNLLPILPFLACLAADWWRQVWEVSLARRAVRPLLLIALSLAIAWPLSRALVFDQQLGMLHPRDQLAEWVLTLPPTRKVAIQIHRNLSPPSILREQGYRYVAISSHAYGPVLRQPDRYPRLAQVLLELYQEGQEIMVFRNPYFDADFFAPARLANSATINVYHGPTIRVLDLEAPPSP